MAGGKRYVPGHRAQALRVRREHHYGSGRSAPSRPSLKKYKLFVCNGQLCKYIGEKRKKTPVTHSTNWVEQISGVGVRQQLGAVTPNIENIQR